MREDERHRRPTAPPPAGAGSASALAARALPPLILLLGLALHGIGVLQPLDQPHWRTIDDAAIARNFAREGLDPAFPRVDWRGEGPGFVEMEFPFLPWALGVAHRVAGVPLRWGRLLAFLATCAAALIFDALARRRLPPAGRAVALAAFVLNPTLAGVSNEIQPDALMLALALGAILSFEAWLSARSGRLWPASLLAALAVLAKAPAALILPVVAVRSLRHQGGWRKGLSGAARVSLAAALPAAVWYGHAHGLWLRYGNSLGLSDESHWIGVDMLGHPGFLADIAKLEFAAVILPGGALLLLLAIAARWRGRGCDLEVAWLGAAYLFYLAAGRTTGDAWAAYYHLASLPPTALMVGAAAQFLLEAGRGRALLFAAPAAAIGGAAWGLARSADSGLSPPALVSAAAAGAAAGALAAAFLLLPGRASGSRRTVLAALGALAATVLVLDGARRSWWHDRPRPPHALHECARSFAPLLDGARRIVASGGDCRDPTGRPVAYHKPYMFFWTGTTGFSVCRQELGSVDVSRFLAAGARWMIVEVQDLDAAPGGWRLVERHRVRARCPEAFLIDLSEEPVTPANGASGGRGG
ncbi:MAG: DUF2029 domain-containing protein [Acidobacteria bacterium]|nr:MAG: DUF2029 domain-containing protein [Acidobacteriota bacterium]